MQSDEESADVFEDFDNESANWGSPEEQTPMSTEHVPSTAANLDTDGATGAKRILPGLHMVSDPSRPLKEPWTRPQV